MRKLCVPKKKSGRTCRKLLPLSPFIHRLHLPLSSLRERSRLAHKSWFREALLFTPTSIGACRKFPSTILFGGHSEKWSDEKIICVFRQKYTVRYRHSSDQDSTHCSGLFTLSRAVLNQRNLHYSGQVTLFRTIHLFRTVHIVQGS